MRLEFAPYLLKLNQPAGTSRGVLTEKPTFFLKVYDEKDPTHFGIGEASVFPGLSPEADGFYVAKLTELLANIAIGRPTDLSRHSSIQFGIEQALLDYSNGCKGLYYQSDFTEGNQTIEINGLIWMGDFDMMLERIKQKIGEGFKCLKLKIGAIEWEKEKELLKIIRKKFDVGDLMIRVDANGAFNFDSCLEKLSFLADMGVDSIEQPIKAGLPHLMAKLCRNTPVAIALDEELIGKGTQEERIKMLDEINPQYIILKPALCGGFSGALQWIEEAGKRGVGWWITSALESNVGLNAIAQFTAYLDAEGPQGLGTGHLYDNNFETQIFLDKDQLKFDTDKNWNPAQFDDLKWNR